LVSASGIETAVFAGKAFKALNPENENYFASTAEVIDYLKQHPPKDSSILIKGSRGMTLDEVLAVLPK